MSEHAKPFITWAGGKTQLLPELHDRLPKDFNRYYEPFGGGAALLLSLGSRERAVYSDINPQLVNAFRSVRDEPEELMSAISDYDHRLQADLTTKEYYVIRDEFNKAKSDPAVGVSHAAMFIFLNKHGFNGLYRENAKGKFNVPWNGRKGPSFDREQLLKASSALQGVDLFVGDFTFAITDASKGDLVFFDSPYVQLEGGSFDKYTAEGFPLEDHVRLRDKANELTAEGVNVMLTNHSTPLVMDLYKGWNIEEVDVRRSINRKGDSRKGKEVIIRNYG